MFSFQTFVKHGLSPGYFTKSYAEKFDKDREKRKERAKVPQKKLRRMVLKTERAKMKGANEALEGSSYQTGTLIEQFL